MDYLHFGLPPALSTLYAQEVVASLRATRMLIGAWCLLSTLEWIANLEMFRADGLLSWRVLSLRPGLIFRSDPMQSLLWQRTIVGILSIRIAAALGLIFTHNAGWQCLALVVIAATSWFLTARSWIGGDGADEIGQIASIGALLMAAGVSLDQPGLSFAGTLLIGGQVTISYFFGGVSKLFSPEWREGRALVGVMGTHSYGHALAARAFSRSSIFSLCVCWLVILCETLFPLVLFAPDTVLFAAVAAFLIFHAGHAYFMGLNTFVWAFAATYPSIIVLNHLATRMLRSG